MIALGKLKLVWGLQNHMKTAIAKAIAFASEITCNFTTNSNGPSKLKWPVVNPSFKHPSHFSAEIVMLSYKR